MSAPDLLRCALPTAPQPALADALSRPALAYAVQDALAVARARPAYATPTLAAWFRENRRLGSKERPAVADGVYGVIRHEALLTRAGATTDLARVEALLGLLRGDRFPGLTSEGPEADYATALSLPGVLASEWLRALGPDEAAALGGALGGRAPLVVRANRARADRAALAARLAAEGVVSAPCVGAPDGLVLSGRIQMTSLVSYREGWFEVQDEASQRFVEALVPHLERDDRVLDLCAGAGGKALALASRGARVRAWDVRGDALDELLRRAGRAGVGERIRVGPPRPAPLVVVDAPCSSSGRLRRDPALRWGLDPTRHRAAQAALLAQAAALVLPGGVLAWATCSLFAAENEVQPPDPVRWDLLEQCVLWPHRDGTDGFAWRIWRYLG